MKKDLASTTPDVKDPERTGTTATPESFDLVEYARNVRDPKMKTFDELKETVLKSDHFNKFKESLKTTHERGKLNLVVLGTGGTFQSAETDKGRAPSGSLEESFVAMKLPYNTGEVALNLLEIFNYDSSLLETGEHIRFIAEVLIDLLNDCSEWIDGFIVTHGTDTMVETVNYLSLILGRGLKKPIIFTGSQDPARTKHSDAIYHMDNCLKVHEFLRDQEEAIAEVMILCGNELVRAAWAEKFSDRDSNAFRSFNGNPLLRVDNKLVKQWHLNEVALKSDGRIPFLPFNGVTRSADVPVSKLADISKEELARIIVGNRISTWTLLGSSTCPNTHAEILGKAAQAGKPVILRSPFHDATLRAGTYEAGSELAKSSIPQIKGTESFIRAKLNWLWHYLDLKSTVKPGIGEVLSLPDQRKLYAMMCMNMVGEWD